MLGLRLNPQPLAIKSELTCPVLIFFANKTSLLGAIVLSGPNYVNFLI